MFVFVYGTLKRGYGNNALLQENGSIFIKTTIPARPLFDLVDLGHFPGLIPGFFYVQGELYNVSEEIIQRLDWLEGHPDFYYRQTIMIQGPNSTPLEAETYFIRNIRYPPIEEFTEGDQNKVKVWN